MFPPEKKPQGCLPGGSNQEMLNAILYWLNTRIPWRDLPGRFGPWQKVCTAGSVPGQKLGYGKISSQP
ncbi:MAG: transposase [Oscillospiraceae bacterium]|nr:transposase [Oscillospiraceae bacterium]